MKNDIILMANKIMLTAKHLMVLFEGFLLYFKKMLENGMYLVLWISSGTQKMYRVSRSANLNISYCSNTFVSRLKSLKSEIWKINYFNGISISLPISLCWKIELLKQLENRFYCFSTIPNWSAHSPKKTQWDTNLHYIL